VAEETGVSRRRWVSRRRRRWVCRVSRVRFQKPHFTPTLALVITE